MQALGWRDEQILGAVTGQNALELQILTNMLFESVLQNIKTEREPYQDPTIKELVQKLPAVLDATAKGAADAKDAIEAAHRRRSSQSPATPTSPPVPPKWFVKKAAHSILLSRFGLVVAAMLYSSYPRSAIPTGFEHDDLLTCERYPRDC